MENTDEENINVYYLRQYALIIAINDNVCPAVYYIISQLNWEFYQIMSDSLGRLRDIYFKHAHNVKNAYHRMLLNRHVEYTGRCIRTVPIPNMMGAGGGIRFLESQPPLFSRDFLRDRTPALANICILTNRPVEFYYRIGIQDIGTVTSGRVISSDYISLGEREDNHADEFRPGRYLLDLGLILSVNPLLLHDLVCEPQRCIMTVARSLLWFDSGAVLEPILRPNLELILDYFTHFIIQFKTVPTAMIDPIHMRLNLAGVKNPKKFALIIDDRKVRPLIVPEEPEPSLYGLTADDLLGENSPEPSYLETDEDNYSDSISE